MELTVTGGRTAASALPITDQGPVPAQAMPTQQPLPDGPSAAVQPAWEPQRWQEPQQGQMPQEWAGQPQPWQGQPQPWGAQQLPPGYGQPTAAPAPTWAAAPAVSAAPAAAVVKRKSGRARAVDVVFGLSMLVAVGGVAFAVGRATAPPSSAGAGARTGNFAGRTGQNAGTGQGNGTGQNAGTGQGNGGTGTGQNAVVLPQASGAPVAVGQQAAPSGAPVIPGNGTGTGTGAGTGTGQNAGTGAGAAQGGGFGRRAGLTGTVSAVGDGTITYTTTDGQSTEVATTDTTTYHQQAAATGADVTVGASVRITPAGGFGAGGPGQAQGAPSASAAPGAGSATARPASQPRTWRSCCRPRPGAARQAPPPGKVGVGRAVALVAAA